MDILENLNIDTASNLEVDCIKIQKMALLFNALEDGWNIEKKNDYYIFKKKHENKKEIYLDNYLKRFMVKNLNIDFLMKR
jgi:hypothetical protein